ncbi:MAG: DMT family protein [Bdellovibrionota bacterium]
MSTALKPILLLIVSNVFMTFAWYGHLKFKDRPLLWVILISWLIAFFEYCLQVPANRMGHSLYTAPQLKTLQEAITFSVFALFSVMYLKEKPTLYDGLAFGLILMAVALSLFQPKA